MSDNISRGSDASRGRTFYGVSPLSGADENPLKRIVKLNLEELGKIRDTLISAEFDEALSWISLDPKTFAHAMGWDIDNKHIIFEKIIAVANLLSNTKVRDYKKVGDDYFLSSDTGASKVITLITHTLNTSPLSVAPRVSMRTRQVLST